MYRKATWTNVGYIILHELCGGNPISQYSNEILKQMSKSSSSSISPRYGSMIINGIFALSTIVACFTAHLVKRRTLIVWGHIIMTIFLVLVGYYNYKG